MFIEYGTLSGYRIQIIFKYPNTHLRHCHIELYKNGSSFGSINYIMYQNLNNYFCIFNFFTSLFADF